MSAFPSSPAQPTAGGLPLVVAAGLLWGTGGIAGAALRHSSGISAAAVGCWRLAVAAALLLAGHAVAGKTASLRLERRDLLLVASVGALLATFQACYFAAVGSLGVSVATLVTLGLAPLLVTIAASVGGQPLPGARTGLALIVALTGLALVVGSTGSRAGSGGLSGTFGGLVFAATSGTGFAAMTLLTPRLARRVPPTTTTALGFAIGAALLLPIALLTGPLMPGLTPTDVALVGYLGLAPTAIAYSVYVAGLALVKPATAALTALLEPVTAAALGAALLGERLGPTGVLGALLVVAGIGLSTFRDR